MKPTIKTASKITTLALLGTFAATALSPVLADPGSQQKNKNQWRNLGVLGAVVAGYGLLEHNQTATVLGAAGAAYSANRYEQDRHNQSQDSANRRYYYGGNNYNYDNNGGYNYNNNGSYPTNGYGNGRTYNSNGGYNGNGGYNDGQSYQSFARRHDNGKHNGWAKQHEAKHDDRHGDDGDRNGDRE